MTASELSLESALQSFSGPRCVRLARLEAGERPERGERGSYGLVIDVPSAILLAAGRLAPTPLLPGRYVYCGSALGGLRARIDRHLRSEKRRHWHVDYLLDHGRVAEVWVARSPERLECLLAGYLAAQPTGSLAIPGFGASDCRCPGHLVRWVGPKPVVAETARGYDGASRGSAS